MKEELIVLGPGENLDHFEIIHRIGSGGIADVYLARDLRLDRKVALKVLRGSALFTETDRERFRREARALAAINHSNVVKIYDCALDGSPLYLVLEHFCGCTLRDRITNNKRLLWEPAVDILIAVAKGLSSFHSPLVLYTAT